VERELRFEPDGEYAVRVIEAETVLVPIRHHVDDLDSIFTLNRSGGLIWEGVLAGKSVGEIAEVLEDRFDVPAAAALADVREFLEILEGRGLIRRASVSKP
jgi:hypothetical protein